MPEKKPEDIGKGKKILIVEDVSIMVDLIRKNLMKHGFLPLTAGDGKDAVELATSQAPDAILMDVMLPRMDGIAALKMLKSQIETKDIPVIMCTAKAEKKTLVDAMRAGAVDYIIKPFKIETLIEKIQKAITNAEEELPEDQNGDEQEDAPS